MNLNLNLNKNCPLYTDEDENGSENGDYCSPFESQIMRIRSRIAKYPVGITVGSGCGSSTALRPAITRRKALKEAAQTTVQISSFRKLN